MLIITLAWLSTVHCWKSSSKSEAQKMCSILCNYTFGNYHFCLMQQGTCPGGMNYSFVTGGQTIDVIYVYVTVHLVQKHIQWHKIFSELMSFSIQIKATLEKRNTVIFLKKTQFLTWTMGVWHCLPGNWTGRWVWSPQLRLIPCFYNWACWNHSWSLCSKAFICQVNSAVWGWNPWPCSYKTSALPSGVNLCSLHWSVCTVCNSRWTKTRYVTPRTLVAFSFQNERFSWMS